MTLEPETKIIRIKDLPGVRFFTGVNRPQEYYHYENGDNPGFSPAYYYYFYDWEIASSDESCTSPSVEIEITVHQNSNIDQNTLNKKLTGIFDLFGRSVYELQDNQTYFLLFDNGEVVKKYNIK